ncbi:MAG TPA: hypothetical protein VJZ75_08970 [Candidatus Bathyarchaeia archaeon]|nr:hypothetical protein [Candidatus Bathyarchaeia archaeon]
MARQFKLRYGHRFSILLLLLVSVLLIPYPHNNLPLAKAGSGLTLSAWGTAIVDGIISPGEYGSCITNSLPNVGYAFRICETNDAANLYLAFEVADTTNNAQDSLYIYFDNNHSGVIAPCISGTTDEALAMNGAVPGTFVDSNFCHSGATSMPVGDAVQNGVGVRKMDGLGSVYEISHPLCSGNSQNFCLHFGDTVGWCLVYFDETANNGGTFPNNCQGPMYFSGDATGFGNIVITAPPSTPVTTIVTTIVTTTTEQLPFTSVTTLMSSSTSTTTSLGLNVLQATVISTIVSMQPVTSTSARTVTSTTTTCQSYPNCSTITFSTALASTAVVKSTETVTTTETVLSPESFANTRTLTTVVTTTESTAGSYMTTITIAYISTSATTTSTGSASTTTITTTSTST